MSTPYNSDGSGRGELAATWGKIPWIFRLGSNHEFSKLKDFILPDERVIAIATGQYGKGRGLVTLTDRRILFTYNGYLRSSSEDLPLKNVNSIQRTHSFFKGSISIVSPGSEMEVKNVYYGGRGFVRKARRHVERARAEATPQQYDPSAQQQGSQAAPAPAQNGSIEERLTKLNSLLERQLITEEEFQQQRQSILGLV